MRGSAPEPSIWTLCFLADQKIVIKARASSNDAGGFLYELDERAGEPVQLFDPFSPPFDFCLVGDLTRLSNLANPSPNCSILPSILNLNCRISRIYLTSSRSETISSL